MGLLIEVSGAFPRRIWDEIAMRQLAQTILAVVVSRARRGLDVRDQPFRRYSTKRLVVGLSSPLAMRLKPKGGQLIETPRGPARLYVGGYAEYKLASRRGLTTETGRQGTEVDLTLSGQMMRSFKVKRVSTSGAVIGLTGEPAIYGQGVNKARPWMALSPEDNKAIEGALGEILAEAIRRGCGQGRASA